MSEQIGKKAATNLRLGHEKLRRIRRVAFETEEPMSELMRRWIDAGLTRAEARLAKKHAGGTQPLVGETQPAA